MVHVNVIRDLNCHMFSSQQDVVGNNNVESLQAKSGLKKINKKMINKLNGTPFDLVYSLVLRECNNWNEMRKSTVIFKYYSEFISEWHPDTQCL